MDFLFTYLLEGSIGIFLVVLFYKILIEDLTFFSLGRVTLLVLLAAAVLLPLISFDFKWMGQSSLKPIASSLGWMDGQVNRVVSQEDVNSFNWILIPLSIYLIGAIYRLLVLLGGILKTFYLIFNSQAIRMGNQTLIINDTMIPASFFNYIMLPSYKQDDPEINQILLHESVHIQKGHTWDVLFLQLIKAIFWFNPAIYLLEKQLREIHEFQADQEVTSNYSPITYSRLLLKQLQKEKGLQFMNNFNQFQTKKRIIMMNKAKSSSNQKKRFFLSIPLLILMVGLFSCNMALSQSDVTGKWEGTEFVFDQTEGPDMSAMIEGGRALHEGGTLTLNEDGSMKITSGQGDMNGSGTWKLENNTIVVTMNGDEITYYEIVRVSDDELVTKHEVEFETPMGKLAGIITLTYIR
ncbi:M56 family metallopeptidase [Algoriphagus sp. SE2]|uniref:M56 family metallopeptidase n=1 Tax=Algoriphagus sp. SE2 TaxID=3141536 RepID=UPI0031CCED2A